MNALNLIWIIPLSTFFGIKIVSLLGIEDENEEAKYWHDAFEATMKLFNTQCEITREYAQPMTMALGLKEYCEEQEHCSQCDFGGLDGCKLADTVPCQWEVDE